MPAVGPFTKPFREQLVKEQWLPLMAKSVNNGPMPMSPAADPLGILSDDAEILKWNTQGLPADPVSAENGAAAIACPSYYSNTGCSYLVSTHLVLPK